MKAWVYMTTNKLNGVIYTGLTNDLRDRIKNHKEKKYKKSFTARYNCDKLVWYEEFDSIITAQARERQLKSGSRAKKVKLIESMDPEWNDLYETL